MVLYGGGGHAKVVVDCLESMQIPIEGIFDDDPLCAGIQSISMLGSYSQDISPEEKIIICIGDNSTRREISKRLKHGFGLALHKTALISSTALVMSGSMVLHYAVVQANTVVGEHSIINTAAVIEHDCHIGDYAHIGSHATLCGGVHVGEGTLIGAGATILPNIKIGKDCIIGAGSVVTQNVENFTTVAGVPSKVIKNHTTH